MMKAPPNPYLEERAKAAKDLAEWRAYLNPPRPRPPQRPKTTDEGSRASNRYMNFITTGWGYPAGPYPLIRWCSQFTRGSEQK